MANVLLNTLNNYANNIRIAEPDPHRRYAFVIPESAFLIPGHVINIEPDRPIGDVSNSPLPPENKRVGLTQSDKARV